MEDLVEKFVRQRKQAFLRDRTLWEGVCEVSCEFRPAYVVSAYGPNETFERNTLHRVGHG